jgi:hypothetical protein
MSNHIDPGVYVLQQEKDRHLLEVGRLFVIAGTPTKQHWFLYAGVPTPRTGEPARQAIYTTPSASTGPTPPTLRITDALASNVELWFSHVIEAPATFDGASYKTNLERTGLTVTYIEGTCVDRGTVVLTAPTLGGHGQIDWALHWVSQRVAGNEVTVGYVDVQPVRDAAGDPIDPDKLSVEHWLLYTKIPATDTNAALYRSPGKLNGAYRTTASTVGPPRSPEYAFQHIEVTCRIK